MKASLFYAVMLTIIAGFLWTVWDFYKGRIPVSDTEARILVPAPAIDSSAIHPFLMDKYELTCGQFWRFDKNYRFKEGQEDFPATNVTWLEANKYAEWAGKRLPTVAEWLHAATTSKGEFMSWNIVQPVPIKLVDSSNRLFRVGNYWRDKSPLGIIDVAGNAWEWTADTLRSHDGKLMAIVKGGFVVQNGYLIFSGITSADTLPVETRSPFVGFRCVKNK